MKKITLILLAVCFCVVAQAQITTGTSSAQVIRTGNRAQAGDFGIYLGGTTTMFKDLSSVDNFKALPLINLKYMLTDRLEARLGIEWWSKSETIDIPGEEIETEDGQTATVGGGEQTTSESSMFFSPGIAYHFSKNNLLDVYAGAELPFGWGGSGYESDGEEEEAANFKIGAGAFIGLQAYIGNLPLALGMEYGIHSMYNTVSDGTLSKDGSTISFQKDVDSSKWELGHQVRFTITYFFKL